MASYEGWAVVSLMGHNERYGWIQEADLSKSGCGC